MGKAATAWPHRRQHAAGQRPPPAPQAVQPARGVWRRPPAVGQGRERTGCTSAAGHVGGSKQPPHQPAASPRFAGLMGAHRQAVPTGAAPTSCTPGAAAGRGSCWGSHAVAAAAMGLLLLAAAAPVAPVDAWPAQHHYQHGGMHHQHRHRPRAAAVLPQLTQRDDGLARRQQPMAALVPQQGGAARRVGQGGAGTDCTRRRLCGSCGGRGGDGAAGRHGLRIACGRRRRAHFSCPVRCKHVGRSAEAHGGGRELHTPFRKKKRPRLEGAAAMNTE